jgi:hypothetical protein
MRTFVFLLTGFIVVQSFGQVALTPATPAISPPSPALVPGSPALTSPASNTGLATTNATLAALSDSLAVLQTNIQQALPILINFNDNFDFVSLSGTGTVSTTANPSDNFAVNAGVNFATNLAVNSAVPTGLSLFNTRANAMAQVRPATSQGVATMPVTRDVLRALLVLQSDMQRMLPLLNALNGGSTNLPGGFPALFGGPATSP